jgi:hypothetical protein
MTALSIQPPFPIITDIDGQPLEDGYIWIGVANLPPIGNPIAVYWDAALTQPAALPVRTRGGYPVNAGTPARLYVNSDYSIQVQNRNGSVVYSAPQATERYSDPVISGIDSSEVTFLQAGSGAVVRTAQSKMRDVVSVKDFGAVGDGVVDDTVAIQAALNAAIGGGYKKIVFPQGNYFVSSTITIPSYYSASIAPQLWGSVGQDFQIDFCHSTITTSIAGGSTLFDIPVGNYPLSRYFLDITGGTFFPNNSNVDVFRINGGSMWMCRFNGQSVPPGRDVNSLVLLYNTSTSYQPGLVSIRDAVVSGESVFTFDGTAGGLLYADNFTIDNIYHFGTSNSGGTIRFIGGTGLTAARIAKIAQVGLGKIIAGGGTGGYCSYSSLIDLYSESTTNNVFLVDCALIYSNLKNCRLYIVDHTTQTTGWYTGLASNSAFDSLQVNSGTAPGGGVWYNTAAYAYYPIIQFAAASISNRVSGYTNNEYKNVVNGRTGAAIQVDGTSPRQLLTSFDYTGASISTTGFTQCGSTVPGVQLLGRKFVLDIELSGAAYDPSAKVLAVECRIGSATISIGPDISITSGQWKARGRILFTLVSGTTYNAILSFGESWSSATVGTNKAGTVDLSPVSFSETDAISFGLNAKTLTAAGVTIGDGTMEVLSRFGIYDSLA